MKYMRHFFIIGLLASAQAWACPNLAGTYTCTSDQGSNQIVVTQDDKNGVTTYRFNGEALFITDGQTRRWPDDADIKNISVASSCNGSSALVADVRADVYDSGSYIGNLEMAMTFSNQSENGKLVQKSEGKLVAIDGKTYPVNSESSCDRN